MNMYFEKFSRSEIKVPNPNTPKDIKIASETAQKSATAKTCCFISP